MPDLLHLLLHACKVGRSESVRIIIEVWGADIQATATHFLEEQTAKDMGLRVNALLGVTPLLIAVLYNRRKVARYLIAKGADVSARTSANNEGPFAGITPVHAALLHLSFCPDERCSRMVTKIIRLLLESGADPSVSSSDGTPAWMFSCLFNHQKVFPFFQRTNIPAITLLVEHGMSLDQRCPKLKRTLLHLMAGPANEFENKKIIKLLLKKGADPQVRDRHGLTPIMTAAIGNNMIPNMSILKFFMEKDDIPNKDKIEAVEVALAVLLSYNMNLVHTRDIDYCLSRSQSLRTIEGIVLTPKTPVNGRAVEWATSSDIEHIQQRPLDLGMQSILIRLRIFSCIGWNIIYRYLCPYVRQKYRRRLIKKKQYAQVLDISWTMLEIISRLAPATHSDNRNQVYIETVKAVKILVDTLSKLETKDNPLFNVETLKTSFELISSTFRYLFTRFNSDHTMMCIKSTLRKMISILVDLPDAMIQPIADYLSKIVGENNRVLDQLKLIHAACMEQTERTCDIVRLLLKFGAVPDAVDRKGDSPLHILARSNGEFTDSIARVLLDAGAHLDRTNKEGMTAADVWMDKREQENKRRRREDQQPGGWRVLPDWLREDVPKLLCLSARIIRSRRIPYKKVVPVTLHPFVAIH